MSAYAVATPVVKSPAPELPHSFDTPRWVHANSPGIEGAVADRALAGLLDLLADRIADIVVARLDASTEPQGGEWLDSRQAAVYLGVHRDTLRRLAAERAVPSEQDGPGCKLYFLRDDLDAWRRGGGRPAQLAAVA